MKNNRSLKDLKIQTHRFMEESYHYIKPPVLPSSPNVHVNIDSLSNALKQLQNTTPKHQLQKTHKYTQSQTQLQIPGAIRFQGTSPKYPRTEIKTDRVMEKGTENL